MKRLILFLVLAAAQIAVPAYMIARHENTLTSGERYLFLCSEILAFHDRYVILRFLHDDALPGDRAFHPGETAYVQLLPGEDGFARPGRLSARAPGEGAYLRVRIGRGGAPAGSTAEVILPFDRYFMKESRAREVVAAYRKPGEEAESRPRVHAAVRVSGGYAVIEELYIEGVEVGEWLERNPGTSS
jgi:hypothetical protein